MPLIIPGRRVIAGVNESDVPRAMARGFAAGRRVHRVPDEISGNGLREDLMEHAGPHWWACIVKANGDGALVPSHPLMGWFPDERAEWLRDVTVDTNVRLHHDGHWTMAWRFKQPKKGARTEITSEFVALWHDRDNDLQLTIDNDEPWARVRRWDRDFWLEHCETAIQEWKESRRALDLKPDQLVRRRTGAPKKPAIFH